MTFPSPDATREEVEAFLRVQPRRPKKLPIPLGTSKPVERPADGWPACVDCGEPDSGTCPDGRCRDCDIEFIQSLSTCRECLKWIIRPEYAGPIAAQHQAECSLRDDPDYQPRDDAEHLDVRKRSYGWAPKPNPAEQPRANRREETI